MKRSLVVSLLLAILVLTACSNKKSAPASTTENNNPSSAAPAQPATETATATPAPEPEAPKTAPPAANHPPRKVAPEAAKPAPPPPPQPIVVPAGTIITVRLQQAVSSKSSHAGDQFLATLSEPLSLHGQAIVPAGTAASGTVKDAKAAGRFKGAATLSLSLDTLVVRGTRYRIQTKAANQTTKGKGKRSAAMIGGGAGTGAIIGGIAGGGKGAAIGALVGGGAGTAGAAMTGNSNDVSLPAEAAV